MQRAAKDPEPGGWRWRWRPSPLRRRSDVVEAWVLLTAALLMVAGGLITGLVMFRVSQDAAQDQRDSRHQVTAVLTEDARHHRSDTVYSAPNTEYDWARVRWEAPDGTEREGTARVSEDSRKGSTAQVWTDDDGRQVVEPPAGALAVLQSALWGLLSAGVFVSLVLLLTRAVRAVLDRQRAAQWERAWAEVEPRWRRKTP
ncbi:hypothetical protein DVA86_30760 [Streptomyces armeniacus]|uniref:Uncharacterized protein n=1 Tax=Streptomyces armeniacus TaxID=83291 RepID=A0A345XXE8_9ACTN|nr:hypothetical protein DVA86_30760 [Streptomyces armeniacus]